MVVNPRAVIGCTDSSPLIDILSGPRHELEDAEAIPRGRDICPDDYWGLPGSPDRVSKRRESVLFRRE
jgi:hypothetical protein